MDRKPAVIVISSHVVRGSVGNRAAVFALEVLAHPVWAVPTILLPWHPGHGAGSRIVPPMEQYSTLLNELASAPWLGEVGAVLSGYLGHPAQAQAIAGLVNQLKGKNSEIFYACDPVIGDQNGLYVDTNTASAIRDHLLPIADIITPNRFELAWLSGVEQFSSNDEIVSAVQKLGCPTSLITSAFATMRNSTGNLLITKDRAIMAEHMMVQNPPNGLGDLTAALFVARMLQKKSMQSALQLTTASVFEILARTARSGADAMMLESEQIALVQPVAMVQMRDLRLPTVKH